MRCLRMIEFGPLILTLKLSLVVTVLLLFIGTPLAWWLSCTRSKFKPFIEALTALPLVLPPTVLGFYLLILFNPTSPIGSFWINFTGESLSFSFFGIVLASVIYSLPFMVQPLQSAFENVGFEIREAAASLRASPLDVFIKIVAPLSKRGFLTASILTFAHTLGEFGIILMVGGNIPGRTKVMSIAIYEHVETLDYNQAHILSGMLLVFSFCVLFLIYTFNRRHPLNVG